VSVDLLFPDHPDPARRLRVGSLCTGYGGLDLGVRAVLGGELVFTADPDRHLRAVLATRFPGVPNLGDITRADFTFLAAQYPVDVLTAGFGCQDISGNGRRAGIQEGNPSGLWFDVARAVRAFRPRLLVVDEVAAIRYSRRGLDTVLGKLAQAGYDAGWRCLHAADVGAAHYRERLFLLALPRVDLRDGRDSATGGGVGFGGIGRGCVAAHPDRGRHPARSDTGPTAPPQIATTACERRDPDPGQALLPCPLHRLPAPDLTRPTDSPPTDNHPRGNPNGDASGDPIGDASGDVSGGGLDFDTLAASARSDSGIYRTAIDRWDRVLGRPAPPPTFPDPTGHPRLSPRFVEWLMGLPAGCVTDVAGLPWGAQIRALGHGVVPLQAQTALRLLLADAGLCPSGAAGPAATAARGAA
jgi:DNA (cytosine-5)-methyltransferase 1